MELCGLFLLSCFYKLLIYMYFFIFYPSDTQFKIATDPVAAFF